MKLPILTILFLSMTLYSSGQHKMDTTVTKIYIDSLKRELADLKRRNNLLFWNYQEKANVYKIDTAFVGSGSSIITFSRKNGKPLKRQLNTIGKDHDVVKYTIHYYDNKEQLRYIENWNTLKENYFDANLSSAERIEYDSIGRQTLSVKYLQSVHRTVRRTFLYDVNGTKQINTEIIKSDALWDE